LIKPHALLISVFWDRRSRVI